MFQRLREGASKQLAAIVQHPFNQQLHAGTLPLSYFKAYLQQDALYLTDLARALALTAQRLRDVHPQYAHTLHLLATRTLAAERSLQQKYLGQNDCRLFTPAPVKSPVIKAYTQHLLRQAKAPFHVVAIASITPCFWVYSELGQRMGQGTLAAAHPYHQWINSYAKTEFLHAAQTLMTMIDTLALQAPQAEHLTQQVFITSVEFEWRFWNSIYPLRHSRLLKAESCIDLASTVNRRG